MQKIVRVEGVELLFMRSVLYANVQNYPSY